MRLSLRPQTGRSVVHVDADGVAAAARVITTLNAPTYAPLPTPKPTWSLASFALRALAGSLDALELDMADAPTLGLAPRADVLDDLLPTDEEREEDPRIWSALALAYGGEPRRMPLSDPHLFALPQLVVLDFSAPGMKTPFDDAAAVNLLAADLRALVLLDLSGQTGLTDRGLKALARAQGTRGLRALALRGCSGVGVEGVTACALAWERLEVLDLRGTRCPKGTTIPGFAPRPPALLAESHFHPRSPEQVARALLGKDTPFILVDEEDFGRPVRRRPVLDRPRLVDRAPPPVTAEPAPRVFTTSMPEAGVLLVEPPPPPPASPPEPALPPEPTTMAELRARRLAAFGVARPAPIAPAPPPLPPPRAPALAAPASSSPWTRAPSAQNPLWNDVLARHAPQPHPHPPRSRVPRPDMVVSPHIRAAARAPARARSPSRSRSSSRSPSRSRSSSPTPRALSSPSPSPSRSPAPPPAKRQRLSNPYAESKRKPRKPAKEREELAKEREELAERARFAARLADEGALMFVRVGPPPVAPASSTPVKKEVKVKVRSNADLRAHLDGVMGRRGGVSGGDGAGMGGGGTGVGAGAGAGGDGAGGAGVSSRAGEGASASAAAPPSRRVPFAKAASAGKRGLSTWHGVLPDEDEEEEEDEVVEVPPPPPRKFATLGSKMPSAVAKPAKPAAKATIPAARPTAPAAKPPAMSMKPAAAKSTKPTTKPKMPSLNSGGGGAAARQTTLPFAKKQAKG